MGFLGDLFNGTVLAADRVMTISSLLEMSEAAGLKQLDILVPRAHQEGWVDGLVQTLANSATNSDNAEQRQKTRTFLAYANELRRSL